MYFVSSLYYAVAQLR